MYFIFYYHFSKCLLQSVKKNSSLVLLHYLLLRLLNLVLANSLTLLDPTNFEVIKTPEPTICIKPPSSNTSIVNFQPTSSSLKTRHSPTLPPNNLHITIEKPIYSVPTKNIIIYPKILSALTPLYNFPPALNPQKNPSQSNTTTEEFLRTHPHFKANLPSLYITPTTNKIRFPQNRNFDHYVAYTSKKLEQLSPGKINVFVSSNFNLTFSNLHSMILTLMPKTLPLLLPSKRFTIKHINFLLNKNTPNISYFKTTNSPLLSLTLLTILYITSLLLVQSITTTQSNNHYIFSPYHDPTRHFLISRSTQSQ